MVYLGLDRVQQDGHLLQPLLQPPQPLLLGQGRGQPPPLGVPRRPQGRPSLGRVLLEPLRPLVVQRVQTGAGCGLSR